MLEDFVSKNPGVTYELYRSGTGDVKTKLSTELDAGGTDANVLWFADLGYMYDLDDQGLIYHYSPESAKDLPDTYKYNDGMGHEVRAISTLYWLTTPHRLTKPLRIGTMLQLMTTKDLLRLQILHTPAEL